MSQPGSIDEALLPRRVLLDTSVLTECLGEPRHPHDQAPTCIALWDALIRRKRDVLIAAPSVVELKRDGSNKPFARYQTIEVVAFDGMAADLLDGRVDAVRSEFRGQYGQTCLKFDALIVACAVRHKADVLVGLDRKHLKRYCDVLGLRYMEPKEFSMPEDPQGRLPMA